MTRPRFCRTCRAFTGHLQGCPDEEWIECEGCGRELESYPCAHCIAEAEAENDTDTETETAA